jgi:hypothetical protein
LGEAGSKLLDQNSPCCINLPLFNDGTAWLAAGTVTENYRKQWEKLAVSMLF